MAQGPAKKTLTAHEHELDELDATSITDGYVLRADGAGGAAWDLEVTEGSYTPTIASTGTNPTLGTGGTTKGYYMVVGNKVTVWIEIFYGTSTNSGGTGNHYVDLPFAADTTIHTIYNASTFKASYIGDWRLVLANGTSSTVPACLVLRNSTTVYFRTTAGAPNLLLSSAFGAGADSTEVFAVANYLKA